MTDNTKALEAFRSIRQNLIVAGYHDEPVQHDLAIIEAALTAPAEPVGCPPEYSGPFFVYDFMPQKVLFKTHIGDTQALDVLSVRGWGYLAGGGLSLPKEVAENAQDQFGKWVAQTLNEALTSPPSAAARIAELEALLRTLREKCTSQPIGVKLRKQIDNTLHAKLKGNA